MRRKQVLIAIVLMALILTGVAGSIYAHKNQQVLSTSADTAVIFPDDFNAKVRIAVVSDLHIESSNPEKEYHEDYNLGMLDALKWRLGEEKADLLILSGDNTNSSRIYQHEALIEKLKDIEACGVEVIALAGNHDIETLKREEFPVYYHEFGYDEAYSRDENSLSYSYLIGDVLVLMIENGAYMTEDYASVPSTTLDWMEEQIKTAYENSWQVLPVGHFPMVTEQRIEVRGKEDAVKLLENYKVPLYICGHLHNRNVSLSDGGLTELVVEKMTSYPYSFAIIEVNGEGHVKYRPKKLDITGWAKAAGCKNTELANLEKEGAKAFSAHCEETIELLSKKVQATVREKELAAQFFESVLECLSDGTVYKNRDELLAHPGYEAFMKLAKNSNYGPWIPALLENANPYTEGFVRPQSGVFQ